MDAGNITLEKQKLAVTLGTYGHDDHRSISISHGNLKGAATLTFERTLRVPDNNDVNNLPPSLDQFPLFSVAEFKSRMPEDMASKGGVFLPMYQREAMWINFSAQEPFALKVYVGGVNAVSGVPVSESAEAMLKRLQVSEVKQDYVVLPDQSWLDGIASDDGRIRQFVAMPKGSGYSVEAQITGEEKIGGIQFEMTPVKRGCPKTVRVRIVDEAHAPTQKILDLHEKGLSDASTMSDLKKAMEKETGFAPLEMRLRIESPHGIAAARDVDNGQTTFAEIWISENEILEVRYNPPRRAEAISSRSLRRRSQASASSSAYTPMGFYLQSGESDDDGVAYSRGSMDLSDAPPAPKVEAMSLAAGGLIKQSINADTYPPSIWDRGNSILFNVQLLNAESFLGVTGRLPPSSPISAETYSSYGYPFYDIWNEKLSGVKGDFDAVKSVGAIDEQLATQQAGQGNKSFWEKLEGNGGGDGGARAEKQPEVFKRDESILFPVIMLDMRHKATFKPLKEVQEEVRKLKE